MGRPRKTPIIQAETAENKPVTTAYDVNQSEGLGMVQPILEEPLELDTPEENLEGVKKTRKPRESKPKVTRLEKNILSGQLRAGHQIAALVTGINELNISGDEAEALAVAISDVLQYHDIVVNPKAAAYLNLLTVAGMIYLPKGYAIYQRKKAAAIQPQQPQPKKELHEESFTVESDGEKPQPVPSAAFDIVDELADYDNLEDFD